MNCAAIAGLVLPLGHLVGPVITSWVPNVEVEGEDEVGRRRRHADGRHPDTQSTTLMAGLSVLSFMNRGCAHSGPG